MHRIQGIRFLVSATAIVCDCQRVERNRNLDDLNADGRKPTDSSDGLEGFLGDKYQDEDERVFVHIPKGTNTNESDFKIVRERLEDPDNTTSIDVGGGAVVLSSSNSSGEDSVVSGDFHLGIKAEPTGAALTAPGRP